MKQRKMFQESGEFKPRTKLSTIMKLLYKWESSGEHSIKEIMDAYKEYKRGEYAV